MRSAEVQAFRLRAVDDLEQAAGVAGGDDFRLGRADVLHLAFEELVGHLGLREVVNARAAAAPVALGQFHELHTGDGFQQRARLGGDFLAVAEVAGLVVSHHGFRLRVES